MSSGRAFLLAVLVFAATSASCADPGRVLVTVTRPVPGADVVQLLVTVTLSGREEGFRAPDPAVTALDFPVDFTLSLGRGEAGDLSIVVEGLDQGATPIVSGSAVVTVGPGEFPEATIVLDPL